MKFWQKPGSVPKFHFGTPSDCQLKNEGCQLSFHFFCNLFDFLPTNKVKKPNSGGIVIIRELIMEISACALSRDEFDNQREQMRKRKIKNHR